MSNPNSVKTTQSTSMFSSLGFGSSTPAAPAPATSTTDTISKFFYDNIILVKKALRSKSRKLSKTV